MKVNSSAKWAEAEVSRERPSLSPVGRIVSPPCSTRGNRKRLMRKQNAGCTRTGRGLLRSGARRPSSHPAPCSDPACAPEPRVPRELTWEGGTHRGGSLHLSGFLDPRPTCAWVRRSPDLRRSATVPSLHCGTTPRNAALASLSPPSAYPAPLSQRPPPTCPPKAPVCPWVALALSPAALPSPRLCRAQSQGPSLSLLPLPFLEVAALHLCLRAGVHEALLCLVSHP